MRKQIQDAIFVITDENKCPLYSPGEEIILEQGVLTFPMAKASCLSFVEAVLCDHRDDVATADDLQGRSSRFECFGCDGYVRFEVKKKRSFVTRQMRMLAAIEKKEKLKRNSHFAFVLRELEVFSALSDDELLDLTVLFHLREYPWQFPIIQKGDPAGRFYVLVSGTAEVVSEEGSAFVKLKTGDIFGEMSLLSGSLATSAVVAAEPCKVAEMSRKDFNHALERFPSLNKLFYKLMVNRIMEMNRQHAKDMSSDFAGQVSEVHPIEICQLINSGQKTGRLQVTTSDGVADAVFNMGELVSMKFKGLTEKAGLFEMLKINSGQFTFTSGLSSTQRQLKPFGVFMSLLLEAIQWLDDNDEVTLP